MLHVKAENGYDGVMRYPLIVMALLALLPCMNVEAGPEVAADAVAGLAQYDPQWSP